MKKIILIILTAIIIIGIIAGFILLKGNIPEPDPVPYDPGDYFITDLKDSNGLLKVDLILLIADNGRKRFYGENNFRIRDTIIFILRSKTEKELKVEGIKEVLKNEIISNLRNEFDNEEFIDVFFNEFTIQ